MRDREPRTWQPRDEIDPNNSSEVGYWAERFRVDPEEVKRAISEVGRRTAAVATEFGCVIQGEDLRCP